jgi:hypothetical protein
LMTSQNPLSKFRASQITKKWRINHHMLWVSKTQQLIRAQSK